MSSMRKEKRENKRPTGPDGHLGIKDHTLTVIEANTCIIPNPNISTLDSSFMCKCIFIKIHLIYLLANAIYQCLLTL